MSLLDPREEQARAVAAFERYFIRRRADHEGWKGIFFVVLRAELGKCSRKSETEFHWIFSFPPPMSRSVSALCVSPIIKLFRIHKEGSESNKHYCMFRVCET